MKCWVAYVNVMCEHLLSLSLQSAGRTLASNLRLKGRIQEERALYSDMGQVCSGRSWRKTYCSRGAFVDRPAPQSLIVCHRCAFGPASYA